LVILMILCWASTIPVNMCHDINTSMSELLDKIENNAVKMSQKVGMPNLAKCLISIVC